MREPLLMARQLAVLALVLALVAAGLAFAPSLAQPPQQALFPDRAIEGEDWALVVLRGPDGGLAGLALYNVSGKGEIRVLRNDLPPFQALIAAGGPRGIPLLGLLNESSGTILVAGLDANSTGLSGYMPLYTVGFEDGFIAMASCGFSGTGISGIVLLVRPGQKNETVRSYLALQASPTSGGKAWTIGVPSDYYRLSEPLSGEPPLLYNVSSDSLSIAIPRPGSPQPSRVYHVPVGGHTPDPYALRFYVDYEYILAWGVPADSPGTPLVIAVFKPENKAYIARLPRPSGVALLVPAGVAKLGGGEFVLTWRGVSINGETLEVAAVVKPGVQTEYTIYTSSTAMAAFASGSLAFILRGESLEPASTPAALRILASSGQPPLTGKINSTVAAVTFEPLQLSPYKGEVSVEKAEASGPAGAPAANTTTTAGAGTGAGSSREQGGAAGSSQAAPGEPAAPTHKEGGKGKVIAVLVAVAAAAGAGAFFGLRFLRARRMGQEPRLPY